MRLTLPDKTRANVTTLTAPVINAPIHLQRTVRRAIAHPELRARWRARLLARLAAGPRSLRVQMALGSALMALAAVLIVAIVALLTFSVSFQNYQRTQLSEEASRLAIAIGQQVSGQPPTTYSPDGGPNNDAHIGGNDFWQMNLAGSLVVMPAHNSDPTALNQDAPTLAAALRSALSGHTVQGFLPAVGKSLLTQRLFVAVPVRLGGGSSGQIIGALALSTPAHASGAFTFSNEVSQSIVYAALAAALLAALVATIFSRRLTRPLARLADATEQMATGDYATRVAIAAPSELHNLARSFNAMATTLERDVTELQRQERLRRELVANVSHELATPLTAIQGFTEAVLDGVIHDSAERDDTMRLIARESARLRRLVDQLRQVALFEGGAQALDRAPLRLPDLVEETLAVLAPEIERRRVQLTTALPTDLPPVLADNDRLTEILLNLLDNALRHTPTDGHISVSAAIEPATAYDTTTSPRFVSVAISDSGPGIAPQDRERVFERFYRLDSSRSSTTGGSGLGLAIVRALVEAHGGSIRVTDAPQGGAQFTFTLPIAT